MKKLFISQPMRDKTDEEILAERERAIASAKEYLGEDVEVIDTFYTDFHEGAKPLEYLARSIKDLATADVAYFCKDWEKYRGCRIENQCAVDYEIDVIEDYTENTDCLVSFGAAIEALKAGLKMARKGWNGKTQYIQLASSISYIDAEGNAVNVEHEAIGNKAIAFVGTSGVQMGWLASQADMLAEDWEVVE